MDRGPNLTADIFIGVAGTRICMPTLQVTGLLGSRRVSWEHSTGEGGREGGGEGGIEGGKEGEKERVRVGGWRAGEDSEGRNWQDS